jgi:methylated-DNA-[protein]-cysteine S-methyltransferase
MSSVLYARVPLTHGPWWLAWTPDGVCAGAEPEWDEARFVDYLRRYHDGDIAPGDPADAPAEIDLRFVRGDFRREVLRACAAIPEGETRTYGDLAAAVGRPRAARAVGTTMATNPLPPIVPCHRVVRGDGRIGNYGAGGTARKIEMLVREGVEIRDGIVMS